MDFIVPFAGNVRTVKLLKDKSPVVTLWNEKKDFFTGRHYDTKLSDGK